MSVSLEVIPQIFLTKCCLVRVSRKLGFLVVLLLFQCVCVSRNEQEQVFTLGLFKKVNELKYDTGLSSFCPCSNSKVDYNLKIH